LRNGMINHEPFMSGYRKISMHRISYYKWA
jgi:hypothetical protein